VREADHGNISRRLFLGRAAVIAASREARFSRTAIA